jgi:hypothetical protein
LVDVLIFLAPLAAAVERLETPDFPLTSAPLKDPPE